MKKNRLKASVEFLAVTLLGDPFGEEDYQQDEAPSTEGQEGDAEEEIPVAHVVGLAEAHPLRAPSRVHS